MPPLLRSLNHSTDALPQATTGVQATLPTTWMAERLVLEPGDTKLATVDAVKERLLAAGLAELAPTARNACILIPDDTRTARSDLYVPAIVAVLRAQGMALSDISIILATGTHPAVGAGATGRLVGELAGAVPLQQHDCRAADGLVHVGQTPIGNAVLLSRSVVESDLVLLTGRVTNHYFAGFSGGGKALLPGVAALSTTLSNHRQVLDADGHPDPRATNGRTQDNPVFAEMAAAPALLSSPTFLANTLVDVEGQVTHLAAGEVRAAHAEACQLAQAQCSHRVDAPYDVVIASSGGAPADASLMQGLKTVINWSPAVRDGGTFIWVAALSTSRLERFARWLGIGDDDELRRGAVADYDLFAHNSILLRQVMRRCRLIVVSSLESPALEQLGFEAVANLQAAVDLASREQPEDAHCLVVPHGNVTYAQAADDAQPARKDGPREL